jgi:hypothetical protein
MGEPDRISDERVRLTELMDEEVGDYLDRITFGRCEIVGPAIVIPMATDFEQCTWDTFGPNPRDLLWELGPERRAVIGAIALRECRFVHCNFSRIGVAGRPQFLDRWRLDGRFPRIR